MLNISIGGVNYEWAESQGGLCLVKAARQAIQVGATKEQNGKTYVFNENRRWTLKREEGAAPKKSRSVKPKDAVKPVSETKPVAPAKAKKPLKPKVDAVSGKGEESAKRVEAKYSRKEAGSVDPFNPKMSEKNALGKELSYAGTRQDTTNSRIFGAREEAKYFHQYDQDAQFGWLDDHIYHMQSLQGSQEYIDRANYDFNQIWDKTTPEVKSKIAQKWGGNAKNPLVEKLIASVNPKPSKEKSKLGKRKESASAPDISLDDMLDSLDGMLAGNEGNPQLTPIEGGGKSKGKGKAKLKPIEGGKQKPIEQMSLKEMFAEGDRVGGKYQTEPQTLDERREAKVGAQQFMDETGATVASARASGKVRQLKPKTTATSLKPKTPPQKQLKPKVTPRKGERRSLQPKARTPIEHIETSPEIQEAAAQSPKIASAIAQIKKNPGILEKVQAAAIKNPGAVEDIAVAAIAMAGQFALMPQADLATAALMQGAIGVATRAGARAGKRIREELKTDPNTLKSLQGAIKLGKGILSDLMSKETQEKMISDAIGPAMAAGTGAAVGGGLAGTVAGTGAAVGAAPKAAGAIRQTIANKLQPKRKPLALKNG